MQNCARCQSLAASSQVTTPVTRFQRLGERSRQASTSNEHNEIPIPTAQPEHDTVQGRAAAALVRAATAPSVLDLQMGTPEELAFLQRVSHQFKHSSPALQCWRLTAANCTNLSGCVPCGILPEHGGLCLWWAGHPSLASTETPLLIDTLLVLHLPGRSAIRCHFLDWIDVCC